MIFGIKEKSIILTMYLYIYKLCRYILYVCVYIKYNTYIKYIYKAFILYVCIYIYIHIHTLKKMIFALCSISLIKMSSYNITLGKNGPNLILLNINNVI